MKLGKDTDISLTFESLGMVGFFIFSLVAMWFTLQNDIAEARELPKPSDPEITRIEFDMKDQLIRQTIMSTQEDVSEMKDDIKLIKEKLIQKQ
jgi:hypothetical protein